MGRALLQYPTLDRDGEWRAFRSARGARCAGGRCEGVFPWPTIVESMMYQSVLMGITNPLGFASYREVINQINTAPSRVGVREQITKECLVRLGEIACAL